MSDRPPLYHTTIGTAGATLVFLAGVGGTTRYWERRITPLAATHHVLLVDLLGYGQSPKPWTTYSVDRHVTELRRVLAGRQQLTLIGHSFGAIVAIAYAARYPLQVARLVVLSVPYFGSETAARHFFRQHATLESWFMTNIVLATLACILTRRVLRRALPYVLKDMPREVVDDLALHTWRSSTSTIWDGIYRYDLAVDVLRLPPEMPVLLMHGDRDTTAPLDGARQLAAYHRNSTLIMLPGVDHHPLLRVPEQCIAAIRQFTDAESFHPAGETVVLPMSDGPLAAHQRSVSGATGSAQLPSLNKTTEVIRNSR